MVFYLPIFENVADIGDENVAKITSAISSYMQLFKYLNPRINE